METIKLIDFNCKQEKNQTNNEELFGFPRVDFLLFNAMKKEKQTKCWKET